MAGKKNIEEVEEVVVDTPTPTKKPYMIPISPDPQEDEYVYVSVNLKNYRIKRGETVLLPIEVIEVLDNSFKENSRAYQMAKREHEETQKRFASIKLG